MRVSYFDDETLWSHTNLTARVRVLLDHMYQVYSEDSADNSSITPTTSIVDPVSPVKCSAFKSAVKMHMQKTGPSASQKEVDIYLSGLYPCTTEQKDNLLLWWKQHETMFPVLSRIACDILAIPAVSASIEHLFSSSKHTLSDSRSSLSAESVSITIIMKEWLKHNFGNDVNFLDGVSIH